MLCGQLKPANVGFWRIDRMRSLAALVVVFFHTYASGGLFPMGYLFVDFFVLSGFVIGMAYLPRIKTGELAAGRFMAIRVVS
jgi:peptidoglycan/LPS O-acetylase OafA/YrhL